MSVGVIGIGKYRTALHQVKVKRVDTSGPRGATRTTDAANNKSVIDRFFVDHRGDPQSFSRMGLVELPLGDGARLAAWCLLDVDIAR